MKYSMKVTYSKKVKRITLQRFLCTKIIYEVDEVTLTDILTLYDNLIHLQQLSDSNKEFRKKFGIALEALSKCLKNFRIRDSKNMLKTVKKLSIQLRQIPEDFMYPKRNLRTIEPKIRNLYQLQKSKPSGIPLSQTKPKAYIGKGYTDKGTARNPAKDGSPTWQEVASHRGQLHEQEKSDRSRKNSNRPSFKEYVKQLSSGK